MRHVKQGALLIVSILALFVGAFVGAGGNALAQTSTRQTSVIVPYTEYEWWLIRWEDNQIMCQLKIDHEGLPTIDEVRSSCGSTLADQWWTTPPCQTYEDGKKSYTVCSGLYMYLFSTLPKEREVIIQLPPPVVWITLEGCNPLPPDNRCVEMPVLVLTGEEPLPEERIIAVQGIFDGEPFYCEGSVCKVPLHATRVQGATVEFWADSSYGDSSEHFTAQVRVVDTGVSLTPGAGGWYVDVVSSQWNGAPMATCARIWESFPALGNPPAWITTPDHFEFLASAEPYFYLAGRLIAQDLVDVSACPSGGLLPNGYADACGLEMARPMVQEWQNQFDNRIIAVANETGVPGQLMKNLFAQESQFWPGIYRIPFEYGLGQITDQGADVIFLWNADFFKQFCPLVLSPEACAGGYLGLTLEHQAILRGALALQARGDCPDCPAGVDLTNTNFTVSLFANTLVANCAQVARTIYTATEQMAGRLSTYEDLWRFTIANYHAGPGCTSYAIHVAWQTTGELTWEQVSKNFTEPCQGVVPYVEQITR